MSRRAKLAIEISLTGMSGEERKYLWVGFIASQSMLTFAGEIVRNLIVIALLPRAALV
jgi:hypothetical protein